jgi:CspA family cold shock protein
MAIDGIIRGLRKEKGFGFVARPGAERDAEYFFHRSDVVGAVPFADLYEGQAVTFDEGRSPKGPRATRVALAVP